MNRLVLIGNGFDLAHRLSTSYQDFINWYWDGRFEYLRKTFTSVSKAALCELTITVSSTWYSFFYEGPAVVREYNGAKLFLELCKRGICRATMTPLFERIHKSIENKGWVDIENDYYELLKKYVLENAPEEQIDALNTELHDLQELLVVYLKSIKISDALFDKGISYKIYQPIKSDDISIGEISALKEHIESGFKRDDIEWRRLSELYDYSSLTKGYVDDYRAKYEKNPNILNKEEPPMELMLPNHIMLLNFNYTHTANLYCKKGDIFIVNQIHGDLNEPKSVIFGYGDELDNNYKLKCTAEPTLMCSS
jgi:hypothetical protein